MPVRERHASLFGIPTLRGIRAFYANVKDKPLPSTFMGESDCHDRLCIAMKAIRQGMKEQGKGPSKGYLLFSYF